MKKTSVCIVNNDERVRHGLKLILNQSKEFEVTDETGSVEECLDIM